MRANHYLISVNPQHHGDIRLKTDIKLTGKSPAGVNIYSFKYKGDDKTYEGVMAQEVPWASINMKRWILQSRLF